MYTSVIDSSKFSRGNGPDLDGSFCDTHLKDVNVLHYPDDVDFHGGEAVLSFSGRVKSLDEFIKEFRNIERLGFQKIDMTDL